MREDGRDWWTEKQVETLRAFLDLDAKLDTKKALQQLYSDQLENGMIEPMEFEDPLSCMNWAQTQICIPDLYDSENQFVLLLPETRWKLGDSSHFLELEILYCNGKIELIQEMSGLWNRIEWTEDYIKRGYYQP